MYTFLYSWVLSFSLRVCCPVALLTRVARWWLVSESGAPLVPH